MIETVVGKNFLSWETLDFKLPPGVTLIDGWNEDSSTSEGSGKSGMPNAVFWGCYGKVPKDINTDDVIRAGEKSCSVTVGFSDKFSITRTRKPNDLFYTIKGEDFRGKDARETQKDIVKLLGLSFEAACNTIYQAQGTQSKFIRANQEDKTKILSEIVDLEIFDRARKTTSDKIKSADRACGEHQRNITKHKNDAEILERDMLLIHNKNESRRKTHDERSSHLSSLLDSKAELLKGATNAYEREEETFGKRKKNLLDALTREEKAYAEITAKLTIKKLDFEEFKAAMDTETRRKSRKVDINTLLTKRSDAKAATSLRQGKEKLARQLGTQYKGLKDGLDKLKDFIKNPTKKCPTCSSMLKNLDTTSAQLEITKNEREMTALKADVLELVREIKTEIPNISEDDENTLSTLEGLEKNANTAEASFAVLVANIKGIEQAIERMKVSVGKHEGAIAELNLEYRPSKEQVTSACKKEVDAADNALIKHLANPPDLDVKGMAACREAQEECLKSAQVDSDVQKGVRQRLSSLVALKQGFREIKGYVFEGLLQELNTRVQFYLEELFEVPVAVSFQNVLGKIEVESSLEGVPRKLGLFSGGQFRRVGLAIDLALNDITTRRKGSKFGDLIILDEYFRDLSEESMEKCLQLLTSRRTPVLIIEHNTVFKSIIDQTFYVKKEGGVSRGVANL